MFLYFQGPNNVVLNKFTTAECSAKYQPVRLMKQGFDAQSQLCYGDKLVSKDTCQVRSDIIIIIITNNP
ncbi:hypothetical protein HF086_001795 [Spodoptera exigua]|uniref:Uncharacterized protein n=1 Tax=Spodoptera exigua TaxID=7107 RepID=A0A922MUR6_SPOEX|nr:hypothetical protein HF086_001795 [Spodoptera exigua]